MNDKFNTRIYVMELGKDDPRKCTSRKLCKMNLAKSIKKISRIPKGSIILNPFSQVYSKKDLNALKKGVVVIDCSWKDTSFFQKKMYGLNRRLPILLASNPINYSIPQKLSSVEAISAILYISDYIEHAKRIISIYKWGNTFLTLNHNLLEDYRKADTPERIEAIEEQYFKVIR